MALIALASIAYSALESGRFELAEAYLQRIDGFGGSLLDRDPLVRGWVARARAAQSSLKGDAWGSLTLWQRVAASFVTLLCVLFVA